MEIKEKELIGLVLESIREGMGGGVVPCNELLDKYGEIVHKYLPHLQDDRRLRNTEPAWRNKARWVRKHLEAIGVWNNTGEWGMWGKQAD
jgi:hypothetical protein